MAKEIDVDGVTYKVIKQLGQGGQGMVHLVESGEQRYAIKTIQLHNEKKKSGKSKNDRLREEVKYCRKLHSRHVIQIISAEEKDVMTGNNPGRQLQYVMPCFDGTLRDWTSKNVPIERKFNLLHQLYDAVSAIHADGVVHRDIKPENILVDSKGLHLVLADFGIAHFDGSGKTLTKELLANRAYFAPEQMKDKDQKDVGPAADIFALGLITNELFTLSIPRGSTFRRIGDVYPLLSGLDSLVERMIRQNPSKRISIASAKSELKRVACTYRDSLSNVETYLKDCSTSDWEARLAEMKQDALDREVAEEVLKSMGQRDLDDFLTNHIEKPQELSGAEKTRWILYHAKYLVKNDREKYSCENILHRPSKQELQSIEDKIYRQGAEEAILAGQLLKTLSIREWQSRNLNYHHNIRFCPDKDLLYAAQSICFLEMCRKKFEYESNTCRSVSGPDRQSAYDDGPNEEQRAQLDAWLSERCFALGLITDSKTVHGKIWKYFISCGSYHCTELLEATKKAERPWNNAFSSEESAMCLAHDMAIHLISVTHPHEDPRRRLDEFNLWEHVELSNVTDWPLEAFLEKNKQARDLISGPSLDADGAKEILETLKEQYDGVNFEIRDNAAIVNFADSEQYNRFCHEAKGKARGHYIFEGDVIDILVPAFSGDGLTQHIWSLGFDVKHTLAMVLGLRDVK